jgi:hypothetical protein
MKRSLWLAGLAAAVLAWTSIPTAQSQETDTTSLVHEYTKTIPLPPVAQSRSGAKSATQEAAVANLSSLPTWNYSVVASDGHNYAGTMIGASPYFNGARTTNIPTVVLPIIIVLQSDGSVYDPTATDRCASNQSALNLVMGSPIFQAYDFAINGVDMGSAQYVDDFQRANFYDGNVATTGNSYHTVLTDANGNPGATVLPAVRISIPSNEGASWNQISCSNVAVIDYNTFNSIISNTLIPSLASQGYGPTTFIMFLLHDVVMGNPGDSLFSNCCIIGYHGAQYTSNGLPQTYAVADYDTSGVIGSAGLAPTSHEVGEWMDDPYGTNPTPAWGHTGQVSTCQNNLEVGDPLTGWAFNPFGVSMPNGITYNPQQLAFFSWFYGQSPSIGAGGGYSDGSAFTVPAHTCTS